MKQKKHIFGIITGLLCLTASVWAQPQPQRTVNGRTFLVHKVAPKETMYGISRQYNIHIDTLFALNPGATLVIREGQEILIPIKTVPAQSAETNGNIHEVQPGETLYGISRKYGITVDELLAANPEASQSLRTGMKLKIPGKQNPPAPPRDEIRTETRNDTSPSTETQKDTQIFQPTGVRSSNCDTGYVWNRPVNVALLLPFTSGNEGEIRLATEFYGGFKVAADYWNNRGLEIVLNVYNSGSSQDTRQARQLISNETLKGMDLVVGPLYPAALGEVAPYCEKNEIPIVTPFSRNTAVMEAAKGVIKLTPSRNFVIQKTVQYFAGRYPQARFILVDGSAKKDSLILLSYKTELERQLSGKWIKSTSTGIQSSLSENQTNIIFLPHSIEIRVKEFMTRVNSLRGRYPILLVGIEEWLEFSMVEAEYYENLQLHIPVAYQFHPDDTLYKPFRIAFREQFGGEPALSAHRGYETGMYFLQLLYRRGNAYPECVYEEENSLPGTAFRFVGSRKEGFENRLCRMMIFRGYQYQIETF